MRTKELVESSRLDADQYLFDPRSRARFSELLSPEETAALLARSHADLGLRGWAIRAKLTAEEVQLLESNCREDSLELDVVQFVPGLPIGLLRTQSTEPEFRFGVPLWQPGAQDWLLDVVDHGRVFILLDSADGDVGVALHGGVKLLADRLSIIAAATLARYLGGEESRREMFTAAIWLLEDDARRSHQSGQAPPAIGGSLVGRGASALAMMRCVIEADSHDLLK